MQLLADQDKFACQILIIMVQHLLLRERKRTKRTMLYELILLPSIQLRLGSDYVDEVTLVGLGFLHYAQPLLTAPQVPNVRVHFRTKSQYVLFQNYYLSCSGGNRAQAAQNAKRAHLSEIQSNAKSIEVEGCGHVQLVELYRIQFIKLEPAILIVFIRVIGYTIQRLKLLPQQQNPNQLVFVSNHIRLTSSLIYMNIAALLTQVYQSSLSSKPPWIILYYAQHNSAGSMLSCHPLAQTLSDAFQVQVSRSSSKLRLVKTIAHILCSARCVLSCKAKQQNTKYTQNLLQDD